MAHYPTSRKPRSKKIIFFPDTATGQYYYHTDKGREPVPGNDFASHIKKVIQPQDPGREIRPQIIPLDAMMKLDALKAANHAKE